MKLFLVRSEILGLCVNTLTVDYEYFDHNKENLPLPIQIHLSEKPKIYCDYFIACLKVTVNFEHFSQNKSLIAYVFLKFMYFLLCVSEIIDSKKSGLFNA